MARRKSLRSQLYRAARDLGNVQAARGGPTSYGMRVVRRKVYRTTNGINRAVAQGSGAVAPGTIPTQSICGTFGQSVGSR